MPLWLFNKEMLLSIILPKSAKTKERMRKFILTIVFSSLLLTPLSVTGQQHMSKILPEQDIPSPTEGVITNDFVGEKEMMNDLLMMLARFSQYMAADYQPCKEPNSIGEECGCFKGERTMASNEAGVRTNADLSMLCAFLVKYAKPCKIALPQGVTWELLEDLAMKTLVFAYSTHKANKLKVCAGGDYWGSTSNNDHVWESSLWAMSVAYSAFFQWERLSDGQKGYIHNLLVAECNYELERTIPTGYKGDTKAEENGWEANVLAATLGLFPDDPLAPQWMERLRLFAINSYSHPNDATDNTIIDMGKPETVADLYRGQNLYEDYTLQNHNLFHTSYQNVVMQELGEAALALQLFQQGKGNQQKWSTNALMHNNQKVMDEVLNWLALTDGELAMPIGNDWSLFLYDQITSYTTMATFLRDPNALMLENLAYKQIKARQKTTSDGSWLQRPDVQARRMGVEGHRVMMTYLMHLTNSTADMTPTRWEVFRKAHSKAKVLKCQNVVRAFTKDRFTTFSWSEGLKSYTGYIAANSVDKNKIIVPYRANNTGNLLGWYMVSGKRTDAVPVLSGRYQLQGDAYIMNGELKTNGQTLDQRFAIYSTDGNAVIYLDQVTAITDGTITGERGGLMAISVDELTKLRRNLYTKEGMTTSDGTKMSILNTPWLNIDNAVGFVSRSGKTMAFGDIANNNSIMTAKAYILHSDQQRDFKANETIDRRHVVYYSNISSHETACMEQELCVLTDMLPEGWNGLIASDPDGTTYLLISHFSGAKNEVTLKGVTNKSQLGAPVFNVETMIHKSQSTATFSVEENSSHGCKISFFIEGTGLTAKADDTSIDITANKRAKATIHLIDDGREYKKTIKIKKGKHIRLTKADFR